MFTPSTKHNLLASQQNTYQLLALNSKYLPIKKCYLCGISYRGLQRHHQSTCLSLVYWCQCCDMSYLKQDQEGHRKHCQFILCYCCKAPVKKRQIVQHLLQCNLSLSASLASRDGGNNQEGKANRKKKRDKENMIYGNGMSKSVQDTK